MGTKKIIYILYKKLYKVSKKKIKSYKKGFPTPQFSLPKKIYLIAVSLVIISTGSAITIWQVVFVDLPPVSDLTNKTTKASTKIYDRNGILLYSLYEDVNRTPVDISHVPEHVQLAVIAAEDSQFYNHLGFSIRGISRAITKYIRERKVEGGSTITQQLIKNKLLTNERTIRRKLREAYLAVQAERMYTKQDILEMYLNEIAFGGTSYGIEEASHTYFNKPTRTLTLAESALLAAIPKSPTRLSPYGSYQDDLFNRQKEILIAMKDHGFISEEQYSSALKEKISFAPNQIEIKAPHFVMYVRDELSELLGEKALSQGGLEVHTTLDYYTQVAIEKVVNEELEKIRNLRVNNAAAVVISPQTGNIIAMQGSNNYFDTQNDGNVNVLVRPRQPGSSIKVVNYTYSLSHGYTAASIIDDSPITYQIPGSKPYTPKNYDDRFRGKITLRSALAESRNIPAVKVLSSYGVKNMIVQGQKMGINESWNDPNQFGLALTLGGGEVTMMELVNVYSTLANLGKRPNLISIDNIKDINGHIIFDANDCKRKVQNNLKKYCRSSEQVVDPRVAFIITDILSDNNARSPAFGRYSALNISGHPEVAVKTGTSNNLKDNLTVGYNQDYVVGVWVGNNDSTPMSRIALGITGAAPIWNGIMSGLLQNKDTQAWEVPEGMNHVAICSFTGTLPCSGCPSREEWFLAEQSPTRHCVLDQFAENKPKEKQL